MGKTKKLSAAELKKCLRNESWNRIEEIICRLYRSSDQANLYLNSLFNHEGAREELIDDYEKKLSRCFALGNYASPDMKACKKIVDEVRKFADLQVTLSVMLSFVEMGTEFTNNYGDMNESFYNSLLNTFGQFADYLNNEDDDTLYMLFKDRIDKVVSESAYIGWGCGDEIETIYHEIVWTDD
ncbi:MAG: DUF6155 family protein [Clostridiales bacterium]|nr:DUF6155 family protein [Clostridiales bacterium]